jgi:DNA polymerase/3'-5' exonuclease PolX
MDIRFVPYNSKGTAMLYFTGSFEYNKQMRYKANDKGYMLSEYGIYKYTKDKGGKKIKGEQIDIPFHTEEAVCEWLGMQYLPPNERDL